MAKSTKRPSYIEFDSFVNQKRRETGMNIREELNGLKQRGHENEGGVFQQSGRSLRTNK